MTQRKKMIVKYGGFKNIQIPDPDNLLIQFRGKKKFDFTLDLKESKLRNLVNILSKNKKKRR